MKAVTTTGRSPARICSAAAARPGRMCASWPRATTTARDDATNRNPIAMKNGVLALAFEPMYIFERENGTWVQKLIGAPPGQPVAWHEPVSDVEIDGGRIFNGSASWGGTIFEKDPATGNWVAPRLSQRRLQRRRRQLRRRRCRHLAELGGRRESIQLGRLAGTGDARVPTHRHNHLAAAHATGP